MLVPTLRRDRARRARRAKYRAVVEAESPEQLTFAWAGGTEPDTAHCFRVSTRGLLAESVNAVAAGQHA